MIAQENPAGSSGTNLRLFFGIACPALPSIIELREELRDHGAGLRLVPLQNLHLTLRFLGTVDALDIAGICERAEPLLSGIGRFDMTLKGLGRFPRALWIGAELPPHVHTLVATLNQTLDQTLDQTQAGPGIRQSDQPFCPHVTVARLAKSAGLASTADLTARHAGTHFGRVPVDAVHLYSSESGPGGVRYRPVQTFT